MYIRYVDMGHVLFYSLIQPLKYCADYRPYFTIHDSEYKAYTTKTQPPLVILDIIICQIWSINAFAYF